MRNRHAILALAFMIALSTIPAQAADRQLPRTIALKAVTALLVEHDHGQFKQYVHENAERKNRGAGSLLKSLERQPVDAFAKVTLDRVIFFDEDNIDLVAAEYPGDLWGRLRERMDGRLGCIAVLKFKDHQGQVGLMAFLVDTGAQNPQIVYSDDN